jgi:hypothetical protein
MVDIDTGTCIQHYLEAALSILRLLPFHTTRDSDSDSVVPPPELGLILFPFKEAHH